MAKMLEISQRPELDYAGAEALNALCTNLTFCGSDIKRIMLTSCRRGEGKSFLSMNIAHTLASLGKKVALIDADFRCSETVRRYGLIFGDEMEYGVVHYLAGKCEIDEILYMTNIQGLWMAPMGRTVANPLPLLASSRFPDLLETLSERLDYVIVDAPPVGMVIDAAEIAKSCDGILFAVRYNWIRRRELVEARQQIERTGCTILGVVFNQVTFDSYSSKKYYHKAYYNHCAFADGE